MCFARRFNPGLDADDWRPPGDSSAISTSTNGAPAPVVDVEGILSILAANSLPDAEGAARRWFARAVADAQRDSLLLCPDVRGREDRMWNRVYPFQPARGSYPTGNLALRHTSDSDGPSGDSDGHQIRLVRKLQTN